MCEEGRLVLDCGHVAVLLWARPGTDVSIGACGKETARSWPLRSSVHWLQRGQLLGDLTSCRVLGPPKWTSQQHQGRVTKLCRLRHQASTMCGWPVAPWKKPSLLSPAKSFSGLESTISWTRNTEAADMEVWRDLFLF